MEAGVAMDSFQAYTTQLSILSQQTAPLSQQFQQKPPDAF